MTEITTDLDELYQLYLSGLDTRDLAAICGHSHNWVADQFRQHNLPMRSARPKPKPAPKSPKLFVERPDTRPFVPLKPYRVRMEQREGIFYVYIIDRLGRRFTDGVLATEFERLACQEIEELRGC